MSHLPLLQIAVPIVLGLALRLAPSWNGRALRPARARVRPVPPAGPVPARPSWCLPVRPSERAAAKRP